MTVAELKQHLSFFPDDKEVVIASTSGDYWGTTIGKNVSDVSDGIVTWSEYHQTNKVVDEENLYRYDKEDLSEVVILS